MFLILTDKRTALWSLFPTRTNVYATVVVATFRFQLFPSETSFEGSPGFGVPLIKGFRGLDSQIAFCLRNIGDGDI